MKTGVFAGAAIAAFALFGLSPGPVSAAAAAADEPVFTTILLEKVVDRTPDQTWARIGAFCAIAQWSDTTCRRTAGNDVSVGTIRQLGDGGSEMMVAHTGHSYAYVRLNAAAPVYGSLAVEPMARGRKAKIVLTLLQDISRLTTPEERQADRRQRGQKMEKALDKMKELAEGP